MRAGFCFFNLCMHFVLALYSLMHSKSQKNESLYHFFEFASFY